MKTYLASEAKTAKKGSMSDAGIEPTTMSSVMSRLEWPVNIGFLNIRILDIRSVSYSNIRIYSNIGNIPQFPQNEEKGWSTRVKLHNKILLIQVFKSYHPFFDIIPPFPDIETA